jgi:isoquinoline 1-oxidoreductase alpha subunit
MVSKYDRGGTMFHCRSAFVKQWDGPLSFPQRRSDDFAIELRAIPAGHRPPGPSRRHLLHAMRPSLMINLRVNGERRTWDGDAAMPLLWYLRDELALTGTKFGCGIAACGACTVHVDGNAVRACVTPVSALEGKSVVTIEGLSPDGDHTVQKAWREQNVPQCGYCQSGQIMQAAALLAKTPSPSDVEIDQAMAGNICRCGTYPRIRAAIHSAAKGG